MTQFLCYFCEISLCAKSTNQLFTGMEFDTVPYEIGDAHLTYYLVFHITFFFIKKLIKLPLFYLGHFVYNLSVKTVYIQTSMFIRLLEYCKNGHCSRFCFINNAVLDYGAISADSYFNETNSRLGDRFLQQQLHILQPTLW